jgi:hypothetical protein
MRPRVDLWLARADQSQVMSRKSCLINLLPGDRNQPIPGSCLSGYIVFKRVVGAVAWPAPDRRTCRRQPTLTKASHTRASAKTTFRSATTATCNLGSAYDAIWRSCNTILSI